MARWGAGEETATSGAGEEVELIPPEAANPLENEVDGEVVTDEKGAIIIEKGESEEKINEQVIADVREDTFQSID